MQIQRLNKPQGNYVRHCWGTTPVWRSPGIRRGHTTRHQRGQATRHQAGPGCSARGQRRHHRQPNFARNLTRSFFKTPRKRCNSNDMNSNFELIAGELRAKLGSSAAMCTRAGREACGAKAAPGHGTRGRRRGMALEKSHAIRLDEVSIKSENVAIPTI